MDDFEAPRGGKLIQAARAAPEVSGEAAAAQKNRQIEARLAIIDAFGRLGIRHDRWPDFVRAFSTDPQQRTTYNALMTPRPCQPPEFDRLNQSYKDWVRLADRGWEAHREKILEEWNSWVTAGVDEPIEQVKRIRTGKTGPPPSKQHRGRGANTPIERRYEWAARYLLGIPLKEIAGAEADPSTVGKIVREILQIAGWPPR